MATPVLNNSVFYREFSTEISSQIDEFHLLNQMQGGQPTDLGVVDLWAMTQKVEMPLYNFASFSKKNLILVDGINGEYEWKHPISYDLPYIVRDLDPANVTKGLGGTEFKIMLSRRDFSHGEIISPSHYAGIELYITNADIIQASDGWIYTVKLVNNSTTKFLDNRYLQPQVRWWRTGSAISNYGQRYADMTVRTGYRKFVNYVGNANAHVSYAVTRKADLYLSHLGGKPLYNSDGTVNLVDIWRILDADLMRKDYGITNIRDFLAAPKSVKAEALKKGAVGRSYITALEAAAITKITKDIENYLMWGAGGTISTGSSYDDIRLSVGLWQQLNSAYRFIYNKGTLTLDTFKREIYNFFYGKVSFNGPDSNRQLICYTGIAGLNLIHKLISQEVASAGLLLRASDLGVVYGDPMALGFRYFYTAYNFPFLANVKFVINPALDNVFTNDIDNPLIDGFPLSSYSFLIFDVADNTNDNIFLLKKKVDGDFTWRYINGKMDYLGRTTGFQSSSHHPGFEVFMEQPYPAIWVKDPTRLMKIVMKNPITGTSL